MLSPSASATKMPLGTGRIKAGMSSARTSAPGSGPAEELLHARPHQLPALAVQPEVLRRPVQVGPGRVHAGGLPRAAFGRGAGEAAGVGEEVEEAGPAGLLAHAGPGVAVVGEETGVDVVVEVDGEAQIALADDLTPRYAPASAAPIPKVSA